MNFLNKFSVVILMLTLLLTACNKENIDSTIPEDPNFQPTTVDVNNMLGAMKPISPNGLDLGCLTVVYPFDLTLESNTTITINDEAEFQVALDMESPNQVVDFVFPLSILDGDGNATQVADNNELGVAFVSCIPSTGWTTSSNTEEIIPAFLLVDLCLDLVYPVNLEDVNGNTYIANNESEFIDLSATNDELFFSLPLAVIDQDGNQVVINDLNSFFDLSYECDGISTPVIGDGNLIEGFGCYDELVYPADVLLSDGSTLTLDNADDYANLVLSGQEAELQFPFSLADSTGTVVVISDTLDLIEAVISCGIITNPNTGSCGNTPAHILLFFNQNLGTVQCGYSVNYPLQVEAENVTYDLNNMQEYLDVYNMYQFQTDKITIIYPVSITITDNGQVITFNDAVEVCTFISGC